MCHAASTSDKMVPFAEGAAHPAPVPQVDGNLFGLFVEEVACGMHHVVVAASRVQVRGLEAIPTARLPRLFYMNNVLMRRAPLSSAQEDASWIKPCPAHHHALTLDAPKANGHIPEDHRRIRILAWGRGSEGQLGTDTAGSMSAEGSLAQRIPQDYNHPQVLRWSSGFTARNARAGLGWGDDDLERLASWLVLPWEELRESRRLLCRRFSMRHVTCASPFRSAQIIPSVEGKRVLHISAGGKHTMAVVEHDHRPGRIRHGPTTPTGAYGQMGAQSLGAQSVHPRVPSMHPVMASTNNFATALRESASNITTPFSQPVAAAAAAGLQSLQNMVSNSVAPKVKPPVPTSRAGRQVRVPQRRRPLMPCRRQCHPYEESPRTCSGKQLSTKGEFINVLM